MHFGDNTMKIRELFNEDTAVTSASDIAALPNPRAAHSKPKKKGRYGAPQAPQRKNPDGTAKNAVDIDDTLMGSKTIKR